MRNITEGRPGFLCRGPGKESRNQSPANRGGAPDWAMRHDNPARWTHPHLISMPVQPTQSHAMLL